jgi:hypothetical protein
VSVAAGTDRGADSPDPATRDAPNAPASEPPAATRLLSPDAEPFPYTKVRDWIALLPQSTLSDGAFRLYYLSRSVIWENSKGGAPARPVVEITYEEYAAILGRSARTIARFAHELYQAGLWQIVERAHRSVVVPGKARPEVRTVMTIRVHDYPQDSATFSGPVKTWDVLAAIRDSKRAERGCVTTPVSAQSGQGGYAQADATECGRTELSLQSSDPPEQDRQQAVSPAETPESAGGSAETTVTGGRTNLSTPSDVSAGQRVRKEGLKKKGEEENPSLPPTPSTPQDQRGLPEQPPARKDSLTDELAMFSEATVALVGQLYDKTLATAGLQPLSAADRAGLARRIDARLAEGWSLSRVRAVLTGGSLVGVKVPGRLWASRLDDMPAYAAVPHPRSAADDAGPAPAQGGGLRNRPSAVTNDCSSLPDPNLGKVRYQVPDERGVRLVVRWADGRRVLPWCGRCSDGTRTLAPRQPGGLPRACPDCHPEPHVFPADSEIPSSPDVPDPDTTNASRLRITAAGGRNPR